MILIESQSIAVMFLPSVSHEQTVAIRYSETILMAMSNLIVFSVILSQRKLTAVQIVALISLTAGVAIVQLDKVDENASESGQEQNRWIGVLAVLGASRTSGFGGVF